MREERIRPPSMIRDLLSFSVLEKLMHFRTLKNTDSEVKIFFTTSWFLLLRFKNGLYLGLEKKIRAPYDSLSSLEGLITAELGLSAKETNHQ